MDLWLEALRTGWHAMLAHRLRTVLTASTVALGAAAIACLISLSSSVFATILSGVEAVGGRDIIFVESRAPKLAKSRPTDARLTLEDAASLRERVPGLTKLAYLMSERNVVMQGNGRKSDVDVAIGASYRTLLHHEVVWGIDLPADGVDTRERPVLLCEKVARKLFDEPASAVDQHVMLWGHRYRVAGVTVDRGLLGFEMGGADKERVVFVPASVAIQQEGLEPEGTVVMISDGTTSHDAQIRIANAILLQRHNGVDDFEFFDLQALLTKFDRVFLLLKVVFALVGGVGLVVAGAGIMNVLLASVRQRVTELGLRRALGAAKADIERQLWTESVLIALAGGVVGVFAGLGLTFVAGLLFASMQPGWVTEWSPAAAITALAASVLAGVVFGTMPARRAGRLSIIACLRGRTDG